VVLVGAILSKIDDINDEGTVVAESSVFTRLGEAVPESFAPDIGCDTSLVGLEILGDRPLDLAVAPWGRIRALFSGVFAANVVCDFLFCRIWRSARIGGFF